MRKVLVWVLFLMFFIAMPQFINSAEAGDKWKTRSLIKNGQLNDSHWSTRTEDGDGNPIVIWEITPDEKYVQFTHLANMDGIAAWLRLNSDNECVKGIEVKVKMGNDLAGDIRARIGASPGAYGPYKEYTWSQIAVRNREAEDGGDRLQGSMDVLLHTAEADWDWSQSYSPVYTQFNHPEEVDGNTYLIKMVVDRAKKKIEYAVEGFGKTAYTMPEKLLAGWECFWGIGTRSSNAEGSGTIQFGKTVRVLYAGNCKPDTSRPKIKKTWPGNKERNVKVDIDEIKLRFNEAMNAWTDSCEDGSCCPELQKKNSDTGVWEFVENLCGFEYKGTKDFIFTSPEGNDELDPDSWYKVVVPQGYFRNLAGLGNNKFSFKCKTAKPSL